MLLKLLCINFLNVLFITFTFADVETPISVLSPSHLMFDKINIILLSSLIIVLILFYWNSRKKNKILKEREKHYRNLVESTAAIPWELDLNTWMFTYVGPQIEEVTGFKAEEWYVENFWLDHLHPDDKESSILFCTEATAKKEDHEFEYRFVKKNGDIIWIRDAVQVIVEDDKPVYLRGFMFDISKYKKDQDNKKHIELRLAQAQNIAHVGSWDLDLINNELQWSQETFRIFEISSALHKPSYENFIDLVHPEDKERVNQSYLDSLKNTSIYNIEHRLVMPDGRIKYVIEQCDTEYNDKGIAIRSYGTIQDVTEHKRTEEAIKTIAKAVASSSDDDFYQQLVTNMAEMFSAEHAYIGLIDEKNSRLVNTFMLYSRGEILENISYSLHDSPCANVVGKKVCAYPQDVQQLFPKDNLLVEMNADSYIGVPLFSSNDLPIGLVVVVDSKPMKNITQMEEVLKIFAARTEAELERKKAHQRIQQLSLAVDQSPNIIIITNADGIIEYVNQAFIDTTGYSKEDVINKSPSIIKSGEMSDDFYDGLWSTIKSGKTWSGSFHNKKSNGDFYWDEAKISPIKNIHGDITHYLGIQSDITDKRQMELQLRHSQKMDALGKLTGGIAHDYNNMLNVILGYTELMEMVLSDSDNEKTNEFLQAIQHATERGAALTKKLLTFSRQDSTQPESVNINQVLLGAQNMLEKP